jgi:O-antigen ligase
MLNKLTRGAAWLVLACLLIGADLIGNVSAYSYAVLIIATLPLLLLDRNLRSRMARMESGGYLLAFLLLLLALTFSAQEPGDLQYVGNFIFFLLFIPAVSLLSTIAGPSASRVFARLALLGAATALGWSIYETEILGIDRVVGFVNLTNPFAMAGVMLGFLATIGFFAEKGAVRFVYLLGVVMALGTALMTGTRSAIVMIAALGIVLLAFWIWSLQGKARFVAAVASIAALLVIASIVLVFAGEFRALSAFETIAAYFGQGEMVDRSTEIRLNLYYGGFRAFLDSPIFGHGWWHHVEAARPYMNEYTQQNTVRWSHLHNDYVNFAALAGIMGLAAYVIYMAGPILGAIRSRRDSQYLCRLYGTTVLAGSYATFGLFDTSFSMELLIGFGPVCAAALLGFCVDDPNLSRAAG